MLQIKSCGYGPEVTVADSFKAAAVTIGGTLAIVAVTTAAMKLYAKTPPPWSAPGSTGSGHSVFMSSTNRYFTSPLSIRS